MRRARRAAIIMGRTTRRLRRQRRGAGAGAGAHALWGRPPAVQRQPESGGAGRRCTRRPPAAPGARPARPSPPPRLGAPGHGARKDGVEDEFRAQLDLYGQLLARCQHLQPAAQRPAPSRQHMHAWLRSGGGLLAGSAPTPPAPPPPRPPPPARWRPQTRATPQNSPTPQQVDGHQAPHATRQRSALEEQRHRRRHSSRERALRVVHARLASLSWEGPGRGRAGTRVQDAPAHSSP